MVDTKRARKRPRSRPVTRKMPPPIPDTPENFAEAIFRVADRKREVRQ